MNGSRIHATLGAALACFALNAIAQGTTTTDPKMTAPPTTTADPKKAEPKKTEPKKAAPKKQPPPKAPPKKVDGKATTTPQGGTVQKYEAGKAPDLKDSKGNTIPTSPDAYDVSSGTSAPPKKK
jgi:neurofilament heavy polypeptide